MAVNTSFVCLVRLMLRPHSERTRSVSKWRGSNLKHWQSGHILPVTDSVGEGDDLSRNQFHDDTHINPKT